MEPEVDVAKLDPKKRVANTLTVMQPGERKIVTITRHPFGILRVYVFCALVTILTAALAFGLTPGALNDNSEQQDVLVGTLVLILVAVVAIAFAFIATKIYWGNSWTLTTDSLTQVNRVGLFKRQSSQLALDNLEDVSSEQDGMLSRMFNYGTLRVETAGERSKFLFPFCPNPNYYAAQILSAREAFEQHTHQEEHAQPAPPVEPPVVPVAQPQPQQQQPQPPMPPESAAALPQQQPAPPPAKPASDIASYEVPDGSADPN